MGSRIILVITYDGKYSVFSSLRKFCELNKGFSERRIGDCLRSGKNYIKDGIEIQRLKIN